MTLTARLAYLLSPLVWRWRVRSARKLLEFARAERASMLDMRLAASRTPSAARAALYLRHADDEARHAVMFCKRARQLDDGAPTTVRADTDKLFDRLGEVGFLAFVHHGEARARAQFEAYIAWFKAKGRGRDAALFGAIIEDERRHERYTSQLLVELSGSDLAARHALRRVRRWELWQRWLRAGRAITGPVYAIASVALYALVAPLSLLVRWARPVHRGWRPGGGR